jgi:hypothetical protein
MNGTNSRRGFLKGFGLFSAVVAGTTVPDLTKTNSTGMGVRNTDNSVLSPAVDKALAPSSSSKLTLTADNRPQEAMRINSDGAWGIGTNTPQPEHQNRVAMSVGKDNRLWLQVDGEWRRVALEG